MILVKEALGKNHRLGGKTNLFIFNKVSGLSERIIGFSGENLRVSGSWRIILTASELTFDDLQFLRWSVIRCSK